MLKVDVPGRAALGNRAPAILAVLCLAPFVAVLDTTIMGIALPSLRDELGFHATTVQWVLTAYSLSFGGLLLFAGRLGDLIGRKRVLVAGYTLLGAASLLGGLAPSAEWLVVARVAQGAAAAALVPSSLSLVTATYTEEVERNRALAAFGTMVGIGFVFAMLLGGTLTNWLGWRSVLLINVPIAFVAVAAAVPLLRESADTGASRELDVIGAVTATAGLAALIYVLSEGSRKGWASPSIVAGLFGGPMLLATFLIHESRTSAPLLPPSLLRRLETAAAYLVAGCRSMFGIGLIFVLTLFFQDARSFDPFRTGLLFTPMAITSIAVAPLSGRLTSRFGIRAVVIAGLLLMLAGMALTLQMSDSGTLAIVVGGMVVCEAGFMLSEVPTTVAAAAALGRARGGLAAGLLGTSQRLGHAAGLAAIGSVMGLVMGDVSSSSRMVLIDGLKWGMLVAGAGAVLALLVTLRWLPRRVPDAEDGD